MTDPGTLQRRPVGLANAINNTGQVVGFSQHPGGNNTVAWLWQKWRDDKSQHLLRRYPQAHHPA